VQERYLPIIRRVQERRPLASRGTLTTGGSVLLPGLANNRVHSRSHKWSGPAAGKKVAERRVPELIPVLGSQPAGGVSHKPGNRLHYFSPGQQLPPQPLRGLLPILLLGEQRHDGCEQFA